MAGGRTITPVEHGGSSGAPSPPPLTPNGIVVAHHTPLLSRLKGVVVFLVFSFYS